MTKRPKLEVAEIVSAKVKNTNSPVARPEDGSEMIEKDADSNENTSKADAVAKQCSSTENKTGEREINETVTNPDDDETKSGEVTEVESDDLNDTEDPKEDNDVDGEKEGKKEKEGERVLPFKDLVVFIWKNWKIIVGN